MNVHVHAVGVHVLVYMYILYMSNACRNIHIYVATP